MIRILAALLVLSAAPAAAQSLRARGEALVKAKCAPCHAIGRTGDSPNPKSPPLRAVAAKYKLENLEEAFAEGIVVGHGASQMPEFELDPAQIDALMDYLRRLRAR
ncbi:MAG: cytochrome [Hyphomicrobiales bacterium]|nr:cytochrome [Hyphomicrobiales bacterium]